MKPDLILLTNSFPNSSARAEDWLNDELAITFNAYNNIVIVPEIFSNDFLRLPVNCKVANVTDLADVKLNIKELSNSLKIVFSDFIAYPSKAAFLKTFRYNFSLIKNLHRKAKKIGRMNNVFSNNTIIYAYWADNLATTACIVKQMYKPCKVITRGHGFEIFEEQTKNGIIPFRKFQNRYLTKIFADSKKGKDHLQKKSNTGTLINSYSYVGTKDLGISVFNPSADFTILTCSHIRGVKRLLLMPEILSHINFALTWHVLGDGEELEALKEKTAKLPVNIKVIYHGYLTNRSILDFYKNNSVNLFVSLSYSEGLPVSMMEAQSFGIPIMSTNVGGCNEICNEKTGFLIDRDFDPIKVAEKIKEFKNGNKNNVLFRTQCRQYWEGNFNAQVNYLNFAKEITTL